MELTLRVNNPFKGPEFKRLFQEWNQKLKDDGFVDIEDFTLPEPALKTWHDHKWKSDEARTRKASAEAYFASASELLNNGFSFDSDISRRIWELHCSGLSVRKIEKALRVQMLRYRGINHRNIQESIVSIRKRAGLKHE